MKSAAELAPEPIDDLLIQFAIDPGVLASPVRMGQVIVAMVRYLSAGLSVAGLEISHEVPSTLSPDSRNKECCPS